MTVRVHFVGDVMIGRSFDDLLEIDPDANIWGDIHKVIHDDDILIGNLGTTLTSSNILWPDKESNHQLNPSYASILRELPFRFFSLANNHILDFQRRGLIDTLNTLRILNISYTGAGLSLSSAKKPSIIALSNGINLHIFSAADHYSYWKAGTSYVDPNTNRAIKGNEGIWYFNMNYPDDLISTIEQYQKNIDDKDIIIASLHWDSNWEIEVSEGRKKLSRQLVDVGARIIHGHSTHQIQTHEIVRNIQGKDCLIMYSMGDFIDDYTINPEFHNDIGTIMSLNIDANGSILSIDHTEIQIENLQVKLNK